MLLYGMLVVFFAYFYTAIQFNPVDTAGQHPQVRRVHPGHPTRAADRRYLDNILCASRCRGRCSWRHRPAPLDLPGDLARSRSSRSGHGDPDHRRGGARDDEAARVPADDAPLRGFPAVDAHARRPVRAARARGRGRRPPAWRTRLAPRPDRDRRHLPGERAARARARPRGEVVHGPRASWCPTTWWSGWSSTALEGCRARVHPGRVPPERGPGRGARARLEDGASPSTRCWPFDDRRRGGPSNRLRAAGLPDVPAGLQRGLTASLRTRRLRRVTGRRWCSATTTVRRPSGTGWRSTRRQHRARHGRSTMSRGPARVDADGRRKRSSSGLSRPWLGHARRSAGAERSMIVLKSPEEIERMREAGRVTALTIERVLEAVARG